LLKTVAGTGYLVNPEGRIFKRADDGEAGPWPQVTGLDDGDLPVAGRPASRGMQSVMQLLRLSREASSPLPYARIGTIVLDHEIGLSLSLRGTARTIRLGFGDYRDKAAALETLMARFERQPRLAACRMIDLYDIKRIVITLAPDDLTAPGHEEVNVAGT
jgi:cell division protein FtsQ